MPKFIGEENMTHVEKALLHIGWYLSTIHGSHILKPETCDTSEVIDTREYQKLIDEALRYIKTHDEQNTSPKSEH